MYSASFFAILVVGSLISLFFVYAFQVAVFVKDRKDAANDVVGSPTAVGDTESTSQFPERSTDGSR